MTPHTLAGRVALVTGAGGGLGAAYARLLAGRGCKVVVNDVQGAEESAAALRAIGGQAIADASDLRRASAEPVRAALKTWGRLDIVINNAGATGGGTIDLMPEAEFEHLLDVNLRASVGVLRAAWPAFVAQGYGRVVNTASGSVLGLPGCFAYQTTKAALIGLTRALALDGAPHGVKVNAVNPVAWSSMTADIPDPAFREHLQTHYPPSAVAPFVVALCDEAVPCSGELFSVGGGLAARVVLGYVAGLSLGTEVTPGDWLARFAEVLAPEGLRIASHAMEEVAFRAQQLGAALESPTASAPDWSRPA